VRLIAPVLLCCSAAFAQQPARPAPVPELGANLPAQALGPDDLIAVSVYDSPELSRTIRVGSDGFIRLPMLHERIKADGLHPAELETAIGAALKNEKILVNPYVTVTIAEYHSRPISVAGAVRAPLIFQAERPTTLLEAIAKAQGLREDAGREILISKPQPGPDGNPVVLTRRIAVRDLMDKADPDANVVLTGGEEVRIPEVSKIYVVGNVKKPGAFPMQDGSDTTVLEMLALAEGLAPYASKEAFIYRREGNGNKNEIPIPLSKIMNRKSQDVTLRANDILYIPDNSGKRMRSAALDKILLFGSAGATALVYRP
jgi:polysaccharide export outer membrane protein